VPDRIELERRVDELHREHSGRAFAEAVRRYSDTLAPAEREELKAILAEKAWAEQNTLEESAVPRGYFRRLYRMVQLDGRRSPRGNRRDR
jgi:hypothetical protein